MIAAIGAHGASYSITIPQNAKVKAAIAAIDDDAWASIEYTRGGEAQVAETTITAGRRGDKLRGDDGAPAKLRLIVRRTRLLGAQAELWPNWRTTASSPTESTSTPVPPTPTTEPTPPWSSPSETSKTAPGSAAAPQDGSPPTAPGSPAACSRTTSPAGPPASDAPTPRASSPSRPPSPNRLLTVPGRLVNHSGRHSSACRSTGHGQTPSPPPWDTSATCPSSSEPPTAPGAAQPHPTRHQPHQPRTPVLHAPKRAGPHTHQPSGHPAPNRRSHKPVGGFRLRVHPFGLLA